MSCPTNIFVRTEGLEKTTLQIKAWTLQIFPTNKITLQIKTAISKYMTHGNLHDILDRLEYDRGHNPRLVVVKQANITGPRLHLAPEVGVPVAVDKSPISLVRVENVASVVSCSVVFQPCVLCRHVSSCSCLLMNLFFLPYKYICSTGLPVQKTLQIHPTNNKTKRL